MSVLGIQNMFLKFLRVSDINQGIEEYGKTTGAVLLDVRTPEEYEEGHIPKSKNIPLHMIGKVDSVVKSKSSPVFVYCHSGARSRQAVNLMQQMGYENVKNIGGIASYDGKVDR